MKPRVGPGCPLSFLFSFVSIYFLRLLLFLLLPLFLLLAVLFFIVIIQELQNATTDVAVFIYLECFIGV